MKQYNYEQKSMSNSKTRHLRSKREGEKSHDLNDDSLDALMTTDNIPSK